MIEINQLAEKLICYKKIDKLPKVLYVFGMTSYDKVIDIIKSIYEINPIDLLEITVEENKKLISLTQIKIFNKFLNSKAHYKRKLAAINRTDLLTPEAVNNLLKSIEELNDDGYILLFSYKDNLISTLKSRVIMSVNIADIQDKEHEQEMNFYRNNLLENIFWIESESLKVNIEDFLINSLKIAPNYVIKDKILYLINIGQSNINKKLILEYLAVITSNSQALIVK